MDNRIMNLAAKIPVMLLGAPGIGWKMKPEPEKWCMLLKHAYLQ